MIRRPPRSTHCISSAASDVYKRQKDDLFKISKDIEKEMKVAADLLEFEVAARLRDELKEIKKEIMELPS